MIYDRAFVPYYVFHADGAEFHFGNAESKLIERKQDIRADIGYALLSK